MLPCNSIEAALRRPLLISPPSLYCATATTCVALAGEKREQRQYKILRVVYTNSNTVANKRQPGPVKGRGNECTLFPLPHLSPLSPSATVFCSVSFAIFILLQNVFVSTLLYLFCAHTKKLFVALLTDHPHPNPFFIPPPLPCNRQPFSNAAQHSRCHCSLRLCRLY